MKRLTPPRPGSVARDRSADRALFEKAVERLGEVPPDKAVGPGLPPVERSQRPARFAKRVTRGAIEPDRVLDLHGLDSEGAVVRLQGFLSAAPGQAEVVLVVHGRGRGILERVAIAELDRHPRVAEHLPAPASLGGHGARLARLRR